MARRNQPPDRLPGEIRDHPEVVRACREWNVGRLFRVINNLTEEPSKFTVTHIGRVCGLTTSRVVEYMKDIHRVTAVAIIERIADGLHIPGERFGLVPRPWENEVAANVSILHPTGAAGVSPTLINGSVSPVPWETNAEQLSVNTDEEPERLINIIVGSKSTDITAIDSVATVLGSLRRLEDATSASAVLPTVLQQKILATALAKNADGDVRSKAVGLLSEILQYTGWLNMPLKQWDNAQAHLDRASILALEVDDPLRLSTALSFLSYKNLRCGNIGAATALNEAAWRDTRTHIGLRTYLTFQRAEILARSGRKIESLTILREADKLTGKLPSEDELPDSGYWYTAGFFHGQRAFVLHALGDTIEAKRVASEAIAMLPDSWRDAEWAARRRKLAELD